MGGREVTVVGNGYDVEGGKDVVVLQERLWLTHSEGVPFLQTRVKEKQENGQRATTEILLTLSMSAKMQPG